MCGRHLDVDTDATGKARNMCLLGSGIGRQSFPVINGQFILSDDTQFAFTLPVDVTQVSICGTFANWYNFNPPDNAYPFIVLAQAGQDSNDFAVNLDTKVRASVPWPGPNPSDLNRDITISGSQANIPLVLPAGSRIVICGGYDFESAAIAKSLSLYFSGGILFS
jgi:hypothetical protein